MLESEGVPLQTWTLGVGRDFLLAAGVGLGWWASIRHYENDWKLWTKVNNAQYTEEISVRKARYYKQWQGSKVAL